MENRDILNVFKKNLSDAETLKKTQDTNIEKWVKAFNGAPYGNESKNRSKVVSKDIMRQVEWQHPGLLDPFVSSPDITRVDPVTYEDKESAEQTEKLINSQFCRGGEDFNRYSFMDNILKIGETEGTMVVRCGWDYQYEEVTEEVVQSIQLPTGEIVQESFEETYEKTTKNRPTAEIANNADFYIDPTADSVKDIQFVIHRFETSMSELKEDGRYKNLNKISVNDATDNTELESNRDKDEDSFQFSDEPRKKLAAYEYWGNYDLDGDGIAEPIVCTWVNNQIIQLEANPYPDSTIPFIICPFIAVPFQVHGIPFAELFGDSQQTKTALLRGVIDNMAQSNNAQKGIKIGALDAVNKSRFLNGKNFEFNGTPNDFYDGSFNDIPSSVFNFYNLIDGEINALSGVQPFGAGGSSSPGQTAASVNGALSATAKRELTLVRNIAENLVKPLLRKWISYNSEFLDEEQVIRVTNSEFIPIRKDDLSGNIDLDITISTAETDNQKAQELAFMLQTLGGNMDQQMLNYLMGEIVDLRRMPKLATMLRQYQPQPDPMAQQMQQLELQKLQAEIDERKTRAVENGADYRLKEAKARELGSKADLQDLDFLDREAGGDRQHELEKESMKILGQGLNKPKA